MVSYDLLDSSSKTVLEVDLSIVTWVIRRHLEATENITSFRVAAGVSTQSNTQSTSANPKSSAEPAVTQNTGPAPETQGR